VRNWSLYSWVVSVKKIIIFIDKRQSTINKSDKSWQNNKCFEHNSLHYSSLWWLSLVSGRFSKFPYLLGFFNFIQLYKRHLNGAKLNPYLIYLLPIACIIQYFSRFHLKPWLLIFYKPKYFVLEIVKKVILYKFPKISSILLAKLQKNPWNNKSKWAQDNEILFGDYRCYFKYNVD
jgi:hypothetical protein